METLPSGTWEEAMNTVKTSTAKDGSIKDELKNRLALGPCV